MLPRFTKPRTWWPVLSFTRSSFIFISSAISTTYLGGTSRVISLKIACSRSDCARYFLRYFMVILRNIATFMPEYRLKHVSTHARNRENAYSTADYHLKWFSLESEANEAAVSEEGSSSNLYSCEDGKSSVSESEDEQNSNPERDYDDRLWCKLYARDFSYLLIPKYTLEIRHRKGFYLRGMATDNNFNLLLCLVLQLYSN